MSITVYTFEDGEGAEFGSFHTQEFDVATEYAAKHWLRVIANTYEYADSAQVADYTTVEERIAEDDDDPAIPPTASCPACGGLAGVIGQLGFRVHYACRDCGMQFSERGPER